MRSRDYRGRRPLPPLLSMDADVRADREQAAIRCAVGIGVILAVLAFLLIMAKAAVHG